MARLDFSVDWHDAPEDEAYGPEKVTWASLRLRVDDVVLTRNQPASQFATGEAPYRDVVEGPLAGIAEWVVDHFSSLLWETLSPIPKHASFEGQPIAIPGLRDASAWWPAFPMEINRSLLASWQRRHTLGLASSQLALPSLVFVPEVGRVGLFASAAPEELDPNVRHALPEAREYWLEREDLRAMLVGFVDGVLERASSTPEYAVWVEWLAKRWRNASELEKSDEHRRRLRFGGTTANMWADKIEPLGSGVVPAVEGILDDVRELQTQEEVLRVVDVVTRNVATHAGDPEWRKLRRPGSLGDPPFVQGYARAREVRTRLGLGTDPIKRVDVVLTALGVEDHEVDAHGLFRSACLVRDRGATVLTAGEDKGVARRRVSQAAGLGRILFDAKGKAWGAAHGPFARWQETRRASAFAAELLAPAEIVRAYVDDPEGLADDYGISRRSAAWRIHNVLHPSH